MAVWGGLANGCEKKRGANSTAQGEKERYKHPNAAFRRIARRDKKAFLSDQCKEIEENNRMGKTRDLFKKIREAESKGEKERYKHLNAEFQRIARRDKKACFRDQCKEIEENNRMGKTRDLFKKIRDTEGTFHAKMGSINDRNGLDLTEAEDIKKRWQEYMEELYKKIFTTQVIMMM